MGGSSPKGRKHCGKGEIVRNKQFLLLPVFSKDLQTHENKGLFWKGLMSLPEDKYFLLFQVQRIKRQDI